MTTSTVAVRYARDEDATAWDAFVLGAPDGTFFHRFGWRGIFQRVFRLSPHFLIAERGGALTGVLPLVYQRSLRPSVSREVRLQPILRVGRHSMQPQSTSCRN